MAQIENCDTFGITRFVVTFDGYYICTCMTYANAVEMAQLFSETF